MHVHGITGNRTKVVMAPVPWYHKLIAKSGTGLGRTNNTNKSSDMKLPTGNNQNSMI